MDLRLFRVSAVGGDGLIARDGDLVMYVGGAGAPGTGLLAALADAAGAARPDQAIVERLAGFAVGPAAAGVPPFGVVAASADGLLVIVRGKVAAEVRDQTGVRTLSGERAFAWVEEVFDGSVHTVAVGPAGERPLHPDPHTDLRAGVVPGGGVVLHRPAAPGGAEVTMAPRTTKADTPVAPRRRADATQLVEPGPVAGDKTSVLRPAAGETSPLAPVPPAGDTSELAPVPAGLVGEDGAAYPLDRRYVIGRDPLADDAVRACTATPLVIRDDPRVSRAHAHLWVDGGTVWVRDACTPAGTFITAPGAASWMQIGTAPTELPPEWSLRIGERIFRHHQGGPLGQ